MHGYLPGSVIPTTEMVLCHKHPDDYRQIADTLDLIRQTRQPFSSRHRIIDVKAETITSLSSGIFCVRSTGR